MEPIRQRPPEPQYVPASLELHLFFARIMKEHAIFLKAGFTPQNPDFAKAADQYKEIFEVALSSAVQMGNGIIGKSMVSSGELITDYTLGCEQKTQNFTGIQINTAITEAQRRLTGNDTPNISPELTQQVRQLNAYVLHYLDGLIDFKTKVLNNVLSCNMFTANYPLVAEHMIHEADLYRRRLIQLENGAGGSAQETEQFWNQNMMEHAEFTRGLLDPSESALIGTANDFAGKYAALLAGNGTPFAAMQLSVQYHAFEESGTQGIAACKIRSIILPLLADHDLRELNHYLRLLRQPGSM